MKIGRFGESTYVSISESNIRLNPSCVRYCDRLTECWYAVSTGSQVLTPREVKDRCLAEQDDCRTRTKATYCCGELTDCFAFSECHAKSSDEPADCKVAVERPNK